MTLKRIYNLKTQRVTHRHEDLAKAAVCTLLVLLVICGIILLAVYIVKSVHFKPDPEKYGQINYHDAGGSDGNVQTHDKLIHPPGVAIDYTRSGADDNTTTTTEYTSTTIESPPVSTTTSPTNVPPRFLVVTSVTTIDVSNTDYETASSTNDNARMNFDDAQTHDKLIHPPTTDYTLSSLDDNTSSTTEYTSTTIESPSVSTTTSPKDVPPHLLVVSTTKDNRQITTETTTEGDDLIDNYLQWTRMMNDEELQEVTTKKSAFETDEENQTCTSNVCKQSTSRMLALVNHTAEPCEDFYSYACGGFEMNHFKEFTVKDNILQEMPDISTLDLMVPHKKLYHDFVISCTTYDSNSGLVEVSKLLYDLCQNHMKGLTDLIADIILIHPQKSLRRLLPLFDVVMEVGPEKTMIPTIGLPKVDSPLSEDDDMDSYERSCLKLVETGIVDKKNKTAIQKKYSACIYDQTEYLKNLKKSIFFLQIFEHLPEREKRLAINRTVQFVEQKIINQFGFISDEYLKKGDHGTVAVKWLNSEYPMIDWNKLFEKLFGKDIARTITEVRLTNTQYLVKIFEFYKIHSFEEIKTSILSMMAHDMYIDFIDSHSSNDRFAYCLNVAKKMMPDIASMLYLENFNPNVIGNAEKKLRLMFDQLVLTFNASLNENIWVNENIRKGVSNKMSGLDFIMDPYASYRNFDKNYEKLYRDVKIVQKDYIWNVYALKQIVRRRMYATYGKSAKDPEIIWNYLAWPISVAPVRITETMTIVVPTSLIAKFTTESQKIEEFSTIGFSIAQEIARFLYTEKASELFINENEDFTSNEEIHLQDPAYSKKPNIYGIQINDEDISSSQQSRFVDDVALRVTFDAYDQYQSIFDKSMPWTDDSNSKIFYLLTSQQFCSDKQSTAEVAVGLIRGEHLPNYFRVNSMMMNSESFLTEFNCRTKP